MTRFYEITDADGQDLLGCPQEGADAARLAARTMIEDGHDKALVYRLDADGRRENFSRAMATRNLWGEVVTYETTLGL